MQLCRLKEDIDRDILKLNVSMNYMKLLVLVSSINDIHNNTLLFVHVNITFRWFCQGESCSTQSDWGEGLSFNVYLCLLH